MFSTYRTKPGTRQAFQIVDPGQLETAGHSRFSYQGQVFDTHTDPLPGDYVVKVNEFDIYHVPKAVFEARYEAANG